MVRVGGKDRRIVVQLTLVLWFVTVVIWAYLYGKIGLVAASAAPEDNNWTWKFWILMFAIFRLPWLVLGLALVLAVEFQVFKNRVES